MRSRILGDFDFLRKESGILNKRVKAEKLRKVLILQIVVSWRRLNLFLHCFLECD